MSFQCLPDLSSHHLEIPSAGGLGKHYGIAQPPDAEDPTEVRASSALKVPGAPLTDDETAAMAKHRKERWQLQDVGRGLRPNSRMTRCRRVRISHDTDISVIRTDEGHTSYKGLFVCALVWECPVCAALVTQKRRMDLLAGIENWKADGGIVLHLVLTIPHHAGDDLKILAEKLQEARRKMMNRKVWKRLSQELGLKGSVRSLEVTFGSETGWHPHTHDLLFCINPQISICCDSPGRPGLIGNRILEAWTSACESVGLPKPNRRGVELQGGERAAKYASKWGVADELTKSHIKHGREGRMSPWDLLRQFGETGDYSFAERWIEFADIFKGKHQLSWSKGLRDLVGLGREKTDEEEAREELSHAVTLGTISPEEWKHVLQARARGELLEIAREHAWQEVRAFIRELSRIRRE